MSYYGYRPSRGARDAPEDLCGPRPPELRKLLEDQGFVPAEPMDPAQAKASFAASVKKLVTIIERANIRV